MTALCQREALFSAQPKERGERYLVEALLSGAGTSLRDLSRADILRLFS
ncbi:MAG: hypothetical protein JNK02_07580 [Planctomycetes bacterium]|nr:hypothetical protein [Planctomycetota bacterium]